MALLRETSVGLRGSKVNLDDVPRDASSDASLKLLVGPDSTMNPILYRYWNIAFPQQTMLPTPASFCFIQLYITVDRTRSRVWFISQFYADEQGPGQRYSLPLGNLVVQSLGTALLSVSYSHIAWIENVPIDFYKRNRNSKPGKTQRVLKLAAFPPPGSDIREIEPIILDIPGSCVALARSIYLEPALATIFVLCEGNMLHSFHFA